MGGVGLCLVTAVGLAYPAAPQGPLGIGSRPTDAEIAAIDSPTLQTMNVLNGLPKSV